MNHAVAALPVLCLLAACSGSSDTDPPIEGPRNDVPSRNGAAVDALLRGPAAEGFAVHPAFVNGADIESVDTRWRCELPDATAILLAFTDDGRGTFAVEGRAAEPTAIDWGADEDDVSFRSDGDDTIRQALVDTVFASDVTFEASYRTVLELPGLNGEPFVSTTTLAVRCALVDGADGAFLTTSPYPTSAGPASWTRPDIEPLDRIPSIVHVFVTGDLSNNPSTFIYRYDTRIAFDDGTYTVGLDALEARGIAEARTTDSARWGEWRVADGVHEFKRSGAEAFEAPLFAYVFEPRPEGDRLDACYGSASGVSIGGLFGNQDTLRTRRVCFGAEGVFTHGSSTTTTSPELIASSGRDDAGTYRLSGFLLELEYGDGRRAERLFGGDAGAVAIGDGWFLEGL